jgi:hypothetical protein
VIVGLGHVARVGKDTAALALARDLGFRRVAFADKIRELALGADPIVISQQRTVNIGVGHGRLAWVVKGLGWDQAKDQYPEVRTFLQNLGVSARNVFGEEFWVRMALEGLDDENVVVSDVRFLNEAEAIRSAGGVLIRINRPGHHAFGHVSETELRDFDWDIEIENDGDVVDLETKVLGAVRKLVRDQLTGVEVGG